MLNEQVLARFQPASQNVRGVLEGVYEDADLAVMRSLEEWTIADILKRVRRVAGIK